MNNMIFVEYLQIKDPNMYYMYSISYNNLWKITQ